MTFSEYVRTNHCNNTLRKKYNFLSIEFELSMCKDDIQYQYHIPSLKYHNYRFFDSMFKEQLFNNIEIAFEKEEFNTIEKLNALLNFCQNLAYKDDEKEYGHNLFFTPDLTLMSQYSDCEDRCILFVNLVNEIFPDRFKIVFLEFENHLMIGIEYIQDFKSINSDLLEYKDKKYLVFEPTGQGYEIGEMYPHLKGKEFKLH